MGRTRTCGLGRRRLSASPYMATAAPTSAFHSRPSVRNTFCSYSGSRNGLRRVTAISGRADCVAVAEDPENRLAEAPGGRIAYEVVGDGPIDLLVTHAPTCRQRGSAHFPNEGPPSRM